MKRNCLIFIEDDSFRNYVEKLVDKEYEHLHLGASTSDPEKVSNILENEDIDLIWFSADPDQADNLELLENILSEDMYDVILIGESDDERLNKYRNSVLEYMVRPLSDEQVDEALSKLRKGSDAGSSADRENKDQVKTENQEEKKKSQTDKSGEDEQKEQESKSGDFETDDKQLVTELPMEHYLLKKTLEFMHSRDIDLKPVALRNSKLGYAYPMLTSNLGFQKEELTLKILDAAVREGYLSSSHEDAFYVCSNCNNGHLHYRETCPKCHSTNLDIQDLIHHFSCAYMGPESDFLEESEGMEKVCPKCGRRLEHIGVDYDKPSVIYDCKNCGHVFQEPLIKAKCHNCGQDNKVDHLLKKELKTYSLTSFGEEIAKGNFNIKMGRLGKMDDLTDESFFTRLLDKEIERRKIADFESSLVLIRIDNLQELLNKLGEERSEDLIKELFQVIQEKLHSSDEAFFKSRNTCLLLLTEKEPEKARKVTDEILENLESLLSDNFEDFEPVLSSSVRVVSDSSPAEDQMEQIEQKLDQ